MAPIPSVRAEVASPSIGGSLSDATNFVGAHELERVMLQSRIQRIELLDLRIPAPLLELVAHKLRIRLVMRRADLIRLGRQILQPGAQVAGIQSRHRNAARSIAARRPHRP